MSTAEEHREQFEWPEEAARHWYVVQTKPRGEARVLQHVGLRALDIETFMPRIEVTRRRAGRRRVSLEPLFPSYLFTRFKLTPWTWNALRWTPGVRRILGNGERPTLVPEEFVHALQERIQPLGFVRAGMNLSQGDRVRVNTGPFAGLEAIFERPTTRRDRVRVLLEVLGTVTPLELEVFDLERV